MDEKYVLSRLGTPTDTGGFSRKRNQPSVLKFGDLELGISPLDRTVVYIGINRTCKNNSKNFAGNINFNFLNEKIFYRIPKSIYIKIIQEHKIKYKEEIEYDENIIFTDGNVCSYFIEDEDFSEFSSVNRNSIYLLDKLITRSQDIA